MSANFTLKYRQHLGSVLIVLGVLCNAGNSWAQSSPVPDLMVVVDTSGSMGSRINGVFKLHIATDAVTRLAAHLPESRRVGAVAYSQTSQRCNEVTTLLPLQAHSHNTLETTLQQLNASGQSSLTTAVRMALRTIPQRNQSFTLLLIVDEIDSCGGDTCTLIRSALEQGFDFSVHIIGLRLDDTAESELRCVAEASGGALHHIRNLADLDFALGQVLFAALSTTTPTIAMNDNTTQGSRLYTPELITTTPSNAAVDVTAAAQIDAPERLDTGQPFRVNWSGPGGQWDYVTLIRAGAPESEYGYYIYIREGNPLTFQAPTETGQFELRYVDGMTQRTLARHALTVH